MSLLNLALMGYAFPVLIIRSASMGPYPPQVFREPVRPDFSITFRFVRNPLTLNFLGHFKVFGTFFLAISTQITRIFIRKSHRRPIDSTPLNEFS